MYIRCHVGRSGLARLCLAATAPHSSLRSSGARGGVRLARGTCGSLPTPTAPSSVLCYYFRGENRHTHTWLQIHVNFFVENRHFNKFGRYMCEKSTFWLWGQINERESIGIVRKRLRCIQDESFFIGQPYPHQDPHNTIKVPRLVERKSWHLAQQQLQWTLY